MTVRVTIDTNLYISGLLFGGTSAILLESAADGHLRPLISLPILEEIERKLLTRFQKSPSTVAAVIHGLLEIAELVIPDLALDAVPRDPDDNRILECAVAGHADFIVTGDKDLLSLRSFDNIPIVTARQFLDAHLA